MLLVILIPILAASLRVVPKDKVGRRKWPGAPFPWRKPGLMFLVPFLERVMYFPAAAFPLEIPIRIEAAGTRAAGTHS